VVASVAKLFENRMSGEEIRKEIFAERGSDRVR
jgi:hypothetical protein